VVLVGNVEFNGLLHLMWSVQVCYRSPASLTEVGDQAVYVYVYIISVTRHRHLHTRTSCDLMSPSFIRAWGWHYQSTYTKVHKLMLPS